MKGHGVHQPENDNAVMCWGVAELSPDLSGKSHLGMTNNV
jgi:hypothetical protein